MISSCSSIVDRKDHVQYFQFQRAIQDNCTCSLTEQNIVSDDDDDELEFNDTSTLLGH